MRVSFLIAQPDAPSDAIVEIEVDSLEQLDDALPAGPDIILLDNSNWISCEAPSRGAMQ